MIKGNYVGVDASLSSTAITVFNKNGYFFFSYLKNYTKPTKWTKELDFVNIIGVEYSKDEDYSTQETNKMWDYQQSVECMVNDIKEVLVDGETFFSQEGYSFSSMAGHLIDLVQLGTLIRNALTLKLNADMTIYSPSTMKKETCGLTYGWTKKGKKVIKYETRNDIGIAGGNFKKHQMMKAIYDYPTDNKLSEFIDNYYDDLCIMKKIPSPIDDLIDSFWALKILMNDKIYKKFLILNP